MDQIRVPRRELDEHMKRLTREGLSIRSVKPCDRDDPNFTEYIITVERRTEIRGGV